MHKSSLFLIYNFMKALILFLSVFLSVLSPVNCQSGLTISVGLTMAFTDNPATNPSGELISGFHGGLNGRFGSNKWYFRPGIELHKVKLHSENLVNPFSEIPSAYFLKVPAQLGLRLIKTENFVFRILGGFQFSYLVSIQDNDFFLDHDTMTDTQIGALIGAGIDLGPLVIDFNFEKGLSELYKNLGYKSDYIYLSAGFLF